MDKIYKDVIGTYYQDAVKELQCIPPQHMSIYDYANEVIAAIEEIKNKHLLEYYKQVIDKLDK